MDLITKNLLHGFSTEYTLGSLTESAQFERFAAFSMVRRHYSRSFDVEAIAMGGGGDTAIDAVAIIVNNSLVTDTEAIEDLIEQNGQLEVTFVFVQAERSPSFDASKIGDFGFGVRDFFNPEPKITRNSGVAEAAKLSDKIFSHAAMFRDRPKCNLYYVTTGKWQDDKDLVARRDAVKSDLLALAIFSNINFACVGAEELHSAYSQTKNAVTRTFEFRNRNDLPPADGINQAFIGYVPFSQFKKIISDESGEEILGSIFYDNVRDWQEYNTVNDNIRKTLDSSKKNRFVFMNNGVTIIARSINPVGSKFTISDYQIVNGCQTSNVLFDQKDVIDDSVCVPLRLIETRDENIMDDIIEATNSQTEIKPEQYFARMLFSKKLEQYFKAVDEAHRIYYERRDGQYDRGTETKTKVIPPKDVIKSFAAVYLEEPHRTTRSYTELKSRVGQDIFGKEHKLEPYYAASYAFYLLENRFRAKSTPAVYKAARYQILLALRMLVDDQRPEVSKLNSHDIARRADKFSAALWDASCVDELFTKAIAIIDAATDGNLERDHVRTIGVRNKILTQFGRSVS